MTNSNGKIEFEDLSDQTLELMLFQQVLVNKDFNGRFSEIADYRWFRTPHIRIMAEFSVKYYTTYGTLITRDLMESVLKRKNDTQVIESNKIDLNAALYDFTKARDLDLGEMTTDVKISKIQKYVKQEALRNALLDSANSLENKNTDDLIGNTLSKFEDIQRILFEEVDFGFEFSTEGIDDTLEEHIEYLTNPAAKVSTGWECLDQMTRGGFLRDGKSLYVFMAQAGLGKSNMLSNLGYNFLKQDLKVMVISMEMSQNVYMRRFDSLITKIDIDDLGVSSLTEPLKEKLTNFFKVEHPNSKLLIKEFPPNSISSRTIEQYIDKMVEQKGWKPDVLILDYLGLINPNTSSKKGESNMYEDGSVVSKELRAISYKYEIPVITAVQCNSSGFDTADIGMANIAESRAIAHNADFIGGLYQTEDEQADGIFHMKILKNRFGDKTSLKFNFNKDTMEFTDINDVGDSSSSNQVNQTPSLNNTNNCHQSKDIEDDLFGPNGGFSNELGMP